MAEQKDINLIAIKSLIECIDNRDIAEGGIFLDDDNAEFVADILRYHYKALTTKNKMEEVAKLFRKELGERFTINFYGRIYGAAFDKHGLRVFSDEIFEDELSRLLLEGLIIGNAVIVNDK